MLIAAAPGSGSTARRRSARVAPCRTPPGAVPPFLIPFPMFVVELSLRLSPMPIAVQRKEKEAAQALYGEIRQALESGEPRVLELHCEKDEHKRISLLSSEIMAVQTYEKTAGGSGGRRPGFSLES